MPSPVAAQTNGRTRATNSVTSKASQPHMASMEPAEKANAGSIIGCDSNLDDVQIGYAF